MEEIQVTITDREKRGRQIGAFSSYVNGRKIIGTIFVDSNGSNRLYIPNKKKVPNGYMEKLTQTVLTEYQK